jgi:uncharacterized protein YcbX
MYKLESLHIYPIKSCRGFSVKEMTMLQDGPDGDRLWMLVDEAGQFISQRTHPKMATVQTHLDQLSLTIGYNNQFFKISRNNSLKRIVPVQIWNDKVDAALEPDLYSQAISQYLGVNCRLVKYAPTSQRRVRSLEKEWKPEVRFADSRPLLIINAKSLEDLNSRMDDKISIERFRPNVVFNGTTAFEEEKWTRIKIGAVTFSQPKKCSRCAIINIDQATGVPAGPGPLKTLAGYRRDDKDINFGVLWIPENEGKFSLQDPLEILA